MISLNKLLQVSGKTRVKNGVRIRTLAFESPSGIGSVVFYKKDGSYKYLFLYRNLSKRRRGAQIRRAFKFYKNMEAKR
jgi:hypothetical protein